MQEARSRSRSRSRDVFFFGILLMLAFWLSPLILIGVVIYLGYRIRRTILKKRILKQIKREWFSQGKYVFFLYSNSRKWKEYFEKELIPKIQDKAVIWNWSTRYEHGWNDELLDAKALRFFRPTGHFYPMAIIFLRSGDVKVFQFYTPYVSMLKSGKDDYQKFEKEFLDFVHSYGSLIF